MLVSPPLASLIFICSSLYESEASCSVFASCHLIRAGVRGLGYLQRSLGIGVVGGLPGSNCERCRVEPPPWFRVGRESLSHQRRVRSSPRCRTSSLQRRED